jgi:hypothetical protein
MVAKLGASFRQKLHAKTDTQEGSLGLEGMVVQCLRPARRVQPHHCFAEGADAWEDCSVHSLEFGRAVDHNGCRPKHVDRIRH